MKEESKDNSVAMSEDNDKADDNSGNVKVMCRFRPLNSNELSREGDKICCEFHPNKRSVTMKLSKKASETSVGTNKFTFDRVFDPETSQREV